MAGIVGNNLDSYLEQQLDEIDLFYSQRGIPEEWAESNGIKLWTSYFLKKNADVYNWITVTEPDGTRFKYESGKEAVQESSAEKTMSVAPSLTGTGLSCIMRNRAGNTTWTDTRGLTDSLTFLYRS